MEKKVPVGKIDFLDTNGEIGETCYDRMKRFREIRASSM